MTAIWKLMQGAWIRLYRLSRGRIGGSFGWMGGPVPVLLLTTTGRRTGKRRTAVLGYLVDGERYMVSVSPVGAGGRGATSGVFEPPRNLSNTDTGSPRAGG